jgi:hypothetical protein
MISTMVKIQQLGDYACQVEIENVCGLIIEQNKSNAFNLNKKHFETRRKLHAKKVMET